MMKLIPDINLNLVIYMAKFVLIALAASIVLLLICKFLGLFRRKKLILNIFTTLYYVYIPLVAVGFTLLFFFTEYSKPIFTKALSETVPQLEKYGKQRVKNLASEIDANRTVKSVEEDTSALWENLKGEAALQKLPTPVIKSASKALAERIGETVEKGASKAGKQAELVINLAKLESVVKEELSKEMDGFQHKVLIISALLLALPFVETIIAKVKGW